MPEQFTVRINRRVTVSAVQHGRIGFDTDTTISFIARRFVLRDPIEQVTAD